MLLYIVLFVIQKDVKVIAVCDVDANQLAQAARDHPNAFTCKDYREAFAKHADKFDAVIVAVPDHSHAPIMLTAMAVVVGAIVILFDPIFQGLAVSLMTGEVIAVLISPLAVPLLYYMAYAKNPPVKPAAREA